MAGSNGGLAQDFSNLKDMQVRLLNAKPCQRRESCPDVIDSQVIGPPVAVVGSRNSLVPELQGASSFTIAKSSSNNEHEVQTLTIV